MLPVCNVAGSETSIRVKKDTLERLNKYKDSLEEGIKARFSLDQALQRLLFKEGF